MSVTTQQGQQTQPILVEEKYFPISLERSAKVIEDAVAHAIGVELEEIAHGMWSARKPVGDGHFHEITVRALPMEEGTSVEIRIEDRYSALSVALAGTLFLVGVLLILPIFYLVARSQEMQREHARKRLLQMHRIWTEISSSVGAPVRAGYRSRPEPVRARVPEESEAEVEVASGGEREIER